MISFTDSNSDPPSEADPPVSLRAWDVLSAPQELRKLLPPGLEEGWLVWVCAEFAEDFIVLLTSACGEATTKFSRYELADGGIVVAGTCSCGPWINANQGR